MKVRVLSGGMIAPDGHVANVIDRCICFLCQLSFGSVVIETCHRGELPGINIRCVSLGDQRVGVSRVAHHQHFNIATRDGIDRLALHAKNRRIGFQQVLALHAGAARSCANQQCVIRILEGDFWVVGADHISQQRKCAVIQLHFDATQSVHGRGDVQ